MGSSDHWELHSTPVRAEHPHKLFGILLHKEICLLFVLFTNSFEFNFFLRSSTLVNLASSYIQSKSEDCPRALPHANSTRFFVLLPLLILRFWDFNICLALFLLWEKGETHRSRKTTKICSVKYIYIYIIIFKCLSENQKIQSHKILIDHDRNILKFFQSFPHLNHIFCYQAFP